MSKQVLKRQLEAFTASNIDNELYSKTSAHLGEQGKKLKRKKRQLTLAEQIKKESERKTQQNHTADNMRYLLFASSRVAAAVKKKKTKSKTEDEEYVQYGDEKLQRYLRSLKRLKGVDPAEKRRALEEKSEMERKASVDSLYESILAGELDGDDLGDGTGLKGRSKDGYQYGNSTKRLKNSF